MKREGRKRERRKEWDKAMTPVSIKDINKQYNISRHVHSYTAKVENNVTGTSSIVYLSCLLRT